MNNDLNRAKNWDDPIKNLSDTELKKLNDEKYIAEQVDEDIIDYLREKHDVKVHELTDIEVIIKYKDALDEIVPSKRKFSGPYDNKAERIYNKYH